jgi:hypothetical protein
MLDVLKIKIVSLGICFFFNVNRKKGKIVVEVKLA